MGGFIYKNNIVKVSSSMLEDGDVVYITMNPNSFLYCGGIYTNKKSTEVGILFNEVDNNSMFISVDCVDIYMELDDYRERVIGLVLVGSL